MKNQNCSGCSSVTLWQMFVHAMKKCVVLKCVGTKNVSFKNVYDRPKLSILKTKTNGE